MEAVLDTTESKIKILSAMKKKIMQCNRYKTIGKQRKQ